MILFFDYKKVMSKIIVDTETNCWNWIGSRSGRYSDFYLDNKKMAAHRLMYFIFNFELDDSLSIDHLCRNTHCVNPKHLEQVTHRENVLRGVGPTAINSKKDACKNGHKFSGEKIRVFKNSRKCLTCKSDYDRKYNEKNKEKKRKQAAAWVENNIERSREIKRRHRIKKIEELKGIKK